MVVNEKGNWNNLLRRLELRKLSLSTRNTINTIDNIISEITDYVRYTNKKRK